MGFLSCLGRPRLLLPLHFCALRASVLSSFPVDSPTWGGHSPSLALTAMLYPLLLPLGCGGSWLGPSPGDQQPPRCCRHTVQGRQRCHQNHLGPVEVTWGLTHLVTLGSRPANVTVAPVCCETLPAPLLRSGEGRGRVMFPPPTSFNGQRSCRLAPGPCYPCLSLAGHPGEIAGWAGGNARTAKKRQCQCSACCHEQSHPRLLVSVTSALTRNAKRREKKKKMQRAV